jgi:hypothetical protein
MNAEKMIDKSDEAILVELEEWLQWGMDDRDAKLDALTIPELEKIAIVWYNRHHRVIDNLYHGFDEKRDFLESIMGTRSVKYTNLFPLTEEYIDRYLLLNQKIMDCFERSRNEAGAIAKIMEQRLKNKDEYFNDYSLEIKIEITELGDSNNSAKTTIEDVLFALLDDYIMRTGYCSGTDSSTWDDDWSDLCGLPQSRLRGQNICYGMHELWEHTVMSWQDIIGIKEIVANVTVKYQHAEIL